jgi:hypothetical protein
MTPPGTAGGVVATLVAPGARARLPAQDLLAVIDRDTTGRLLTNGWSAAVGAGSPLRGWVEAQPSAAVEGVLASARDAAAAPVLDVRSRAAWRWMARHRRPTLVAALLSSGGYQGNGAYLLADAATVARASRRSLARLLVDSWAADTVVLAHARLLRDLRADLVAVLSSAESDGVPRQRLASAGLAEYLLDEAAHRSRRGRRARSALVMGADKALAYRAAGIGAAEALAAERGDPASVPTAAALRALAALRGPA